MIIVHHISSYFFIPCPQLTARVFPQVMAVNSRQLTLAMNIGLAQIHHLPIRTLAVTDDAKSPTFRDSLKKWLYKYIIYIYMYTPILRF